MPGVGEDDAPPKPEPEAPPDMDDAGGDGDGASAAEKKLRRLYAQGNKRGATPAADGQGGREQVGRDAQPVTPGRRRGVGADRGRRGAVARGGAGRVVV